MTSQDAPPARPPVATGITRMVSAAILALVLIGIGTSVLVVELKMVVARLNAVDALEQSRNTAFAAVAQHPRALVSSDPTSAPHAQRDHAFRALATDLSRLDRLLGDDARPGLAQAEAEEAERLVAASVAAREAAMRHIDDMRSGVAVFYNFHRDWKRIVDKRQIESSQLAKTSEDRQVAIKDAHAVLTGAILSATRIHREISAIIRYNATEAGVTLPLERAAISTDGIPPACTPTEGEGASDLCRLSSARVHRTLAMLDQSTPETFPVRLAAAQWALEGYARAGELHFAELSAELEDAFAIGRAAREELDRSARHIGSLTRVLGIVRRVDGMLGQLSVDEVPDLPASERLIPSFITQMTQRSIGTAALIEVAPDPSPQILASAADLERAWASALANLTEHQRLHDDLDVVLSDLDDTLADLAEGTREAAAVWVGLMTTAAFGAVTLLCLGAISGAAIGRRMIALPLAQTTSALLDLSLGETRSPVRLSSHALGFDMLEQALERLRRANIERQDLVRQTIEQRAEIERNLETLARTLEELEHQARHDALTEMPNRRYADEYLARVGAGTDEDGGRRDFTVLHLDVDRFKEINDTLGHDAGDAILRHVSGLLTEALEEHDRAFRIGGDEFLIVRDHETDEAATARFAEGLIAAMNQPVDYDGHACRMGASIGIARARDAGYDGRTAMVNADIALYEAKTMGRNRYVFFAAPLHEKTINRKKLSDRLIVAIEREEFVPVYQPQFYGSTLELRGIETLCRWQHPDLGLLSPGEFMAQAEDSALVGLIDEILLRKAARDLDDFKAHGHIIPKISFNVTASRLMHSGFADALVAQVGPETRVAIELLESMSLDNLSETVRWAIDSLKERGIGIEIDDFGSCRASIAGLISVGPDAMKIDGSIVAPITVSPQHLRLVQAIIEIGETLGIDVIAERVETEEHIDILRAHRNIVLQGYALARPMPAAELLGFLSRKRAGERFGPGGAMPGQMSA